MSLEDTENQNQLLLVEQAEWRSQAGVTQGETRSGEEADPNLTGRRKAPLPPPALQPPPEPPFAELRS